VESVKPPTKGQRLLYDDLVRGFALRVSKGGAKTFVVQYGKRRLLKTLGRADILTLADARAQAKAFIGEVAAEKHGQGPSLAFPEALERYLADAKPRTRASTYTEYERLLRKHFTFTKRLAQITRQDIMEVIGSLRDTPSIQSHAFVAMKVFVNWCVTRGYLEVSPMPKMTFANPSRSRVLTDEELKVVWRRATEVGYPYGTVVQLLILTGQRRGEIAALRRSWIEDGWITIVASATKNGREHRIPLGSLAAAIIDSIPGNTDLLFPARGKPETAMSNWGHLKAEFDKPLNLPPWTLHDLRRTFASKLAALGTPIHVTERILNHVSGTISGVAAVYNRYDYNEEAWETIAKFSHYIRVICDH
jgi:integrase